MKHGKKPTLGQKKLIGGADLYPKDWLVVKNLDDRIEIINRKTNKIRIIGKYPAGNEADMIIIDEAIKRIVERTNRG